MDMLLAVGGIGGLIGLGVLGLLIAFILRRVVATNEVHIVQSARKTVSYGKDMEAGNTYYAFPSWVPKIGVVVVRLPVSVFDCDLDGYEAYDKGRVPFVLDVKAFFRINDSNLAAQRVASFEELKSQLRAILQGAIRTILASSEIETILSGRSEFGEQFTKEVNEQLKSWGVTTVKMIELMDIRDSAQSKVIANIMEKKKSLIEKESRIEVAANRKLAEIAEIEARREVELSNQQATQQVGIRKAEVEKEVGIKQEQSQQAVLEQGKVTAEKTFEVKRVEEVKSAEIARDKAIVEAEQQAKTTVVIAEGDLKGTQLTAEGVKVTGAAKAEAEKLMQLAPVQAQIVLAQEIGSNLGYQTYLVNLRQVEANQVVGVAQAEAIKSAAIKVIANAGSVTDGVSSIGGMFSPAGGLKLGGMLEGFANTDQGKAVLTALGVKPEEVQAPTEATSVAKTKPKRVAE